MLKVMLVLAAFAPGKEPQVQRAPMPDLKTCWQNAADLMDHVKVAAKDGVTIAVACAVTDDSTGS
jgi:hypothetical protein